MVKDQQDSLPFEMWETIIADGSFEASLAALREVVAHLEAGNLRLDDSVRCYEVGTYLARRCETHLDNAELRISKLDDDETEDEVEG